MLALLLSARFRKPLPIVAGILVATLLNHALAGAFGAWLMSVVAPDILRWVLAASFAGMAIWALIPDVVDPGALDARRGHRVFLVTLTAFFFAEMGDKTQIATVAMAAHYSQALWVIAGTTLGMMLANVPAVYAADRIAECVPLKVVRAIAAAMFAVLAVLAAVVPR